MDASTSWSRRSVLVLSASAAGAAVLAGPLGSVASAGAAPASAAGAPRAVTGLRRDHWTPLVGKRVAVAGPSGTVRATVDEIEDLRGAPAGDAGRFAVVLRIDRNQAGIAGLNPITIPGRGVATLLVTAVDRGQRHRFFQIVVNNTAH